MSRKEMFIMLLQMDLMQQVMKELTQNIYSGDRTMILNIAMQIPEEKLPQDLYRAVKDFSGYISGVKMAGWNMESFF